MSWPEYRPVFDNASGVFVTVYVAHELRGCVGLPETRHTLGQAVQYRARAAAFGDPRFRHVTPADLRDPVARDLGADPARTLRGSRVDRVGRHGQPWSPAE